MNRSSIIAAHRRFKHIFAPLVICSLLAQCAVVWTQREYIREGYFDFVLYYGAARILNDGKGAQLYDLKLQWQYQHGFRGGSPDRDLPFNHLPYELLPLRVLAKYPFTVAHALWAGLNLLFIAILGLRLTPFVESGRRALSILMVLAYFPTVTALKMGQDSVITTLLLVETYVSLKRGRDVLAGGLLALGLYKPQLVLPLVGVFVWQRRWSAIAGFVSMALAVGALSLSMVGWDGLKGVLALWLPMIERGNVVWPELMINLRGLVYMVLRQAGLTEATNALTLALSLLTYGITLRLWPSGAAETNELLDLQFALAVTMTALVSFHLYSYDGMLLVIPLVLMLNHVLKAGTPSPLRHRIFFAVAILSYVPLLPNALLSAAVLAWWAAPLPILFAVLAAEIRYRAPLPELARVQATPGWVGSRRLRPR
jgi:hypothetical protein